MRWHLLLCLACILVGALVTSATAGADEFARRDQTQTVDVDLSHEPAQLGTGAQGTLVDALGLTEKSTPSSSSGPHGRIVPDLSYDHFDDDDEDDEDEDGMAPTWLMDGDEVYAATQARQRETPTSDDLVDPRQRSSAATESTPRRAARMRRDRHEPRGLRRAHSGTSSPTLADLALFVRIEKTNAESGVVESSVEARVDAAIGNFPMLDDHVANKLAVLLAVVLSILTFFVVVIM